MCVLPENEQFAAMDDMRDAPLFNMRKPVEQYADMAQEASTKSVMPKAQIVSEALEALGYRAETFPPKSFNDDDYYIYNPLTLELKAHISHRDKWRLGREVNHLAAGKGMHVKHLGIWRLVDLNRSEA